MTVVTLPVATVPEPWLTEQVCVGPVGCVLTVTAKVPPLCIGVENENVPFALTVKSLPPLFCRTRPVPREAADGATDGVRVGRAVDHDAGDVAGPDGARRARELAGLGRARGLGLDR